MSARFAAAFVVVVLVFAAAIPAFSQTASSTTYPGISGGGTVNASNPKPPVISELRAEIITPTKARILWRTDQPALSSVEYKSSDGTYRNTNNRCDSFTSGYLTSHCIILTDLFPGSLYYFRAKSINTAQLNGMSDFSTFQTPQTTTSELIDQPPLPPQPQPPAPLPSPEGSPPPPPTTAPASPSPSPTTMTGTAPQVSGVRAENITPDSTVIRWFSDQPTDSKVYYFTETTMTSQTESSAERCDSSGLVTNHCVRLRNLVPDKLYYYKVESKSIDYFGILSQLFSFKTLPKINTSGTGPSTLTDVTELVKNVQPIDSAFRTIEERPAPIETQKPATPPEKKVDLGGINTAIRTIQISSKNIENKVTETVSRDIQHALPPEGAAKERVDNLAESVVTAARSGDESRISDLQTGLSSSLDEIQKLILEETGTFVDLSPTARKLTSVVESQVSEIAAARKELLERNGYQLYEDLDRDGVSDFDEKNIYKTDPTNAYTSGSKLTDGERVLLGFDVHSSSTERVTVESPIASGGETKELYEVYSIEVKKVPVAAGGAVPSSAGIPDFKERVAFSGRALPNSFVTLYIFSTPVVITVKTDLAGAWSYTLDTELPDGKHELYVATVDAGGKILAKSPAVPFTKTAEAAEYQPLLIAAPSGVSPLSVLRDNLVILAIAGITIVGIVTLMLLGARKERTEALAEKYQVPDSAA